MRRHWRTRDLVDLFDSFQKGYLMPRIHNNQDMEDPMESFSIALDVNWPAGISEKTPNTMELKIESGVPIPQKYTGRIVTNEYRDALRNAVDKMKPGDSVLLPLPTGCSDNAEAARKAVATINGVKQMMVKQKSPFMLVMRKVFENDKKGAPITGFRVWKLAE